MTAGTIAIAVSCQFPLVVGQVLLKRAIGEREGDSTVSAETSLNIPPAGNGVFSPFGFCAGIVCLSLWFFLWLGLLQSQELSRVFPFEGLNPAFMVIAAWLFLKERVPPITWLGVALICVGIAIVSGS